MEYQLAIKKNEIMPFAVTSVDLKIMILNVVSRTKTDIIWYCLYVKSKKQIIQMNLFTKQKKIHNLENKLMISRVGRRKGRSRLGVWSWHVHTAIFKVDNQQGPTV